MLWSAFYKGFCSPAILLFLCISPDFYDSSNGDPSIAERVATVYIAAFKTSFEPFYPLFRTAMGE